MVGSGRKAKKDRRKEINVEEEVEIRTLMKNPSLPLRFHSFWPNARVGGTASSQIWEMGLQCKFPIFFNFNLGNQMHVTSTTLFGLKFSNIHVCN